MTKKSLTPEKRAEILVQSKGQHLSPTRISENTGVPRTTIISFLDSYEKNQCLSPKRGRKPKINDEIRQQVVNEVTDNPFAHLRDHEANLPISHESIRKVLHEEHFQYYDLTPMSPLSEQRINDILSYCSNVLRKGIQPIIFTDECTVVLDLSKKWIWRQRCFHPPNWFRTDLLKCPDSLTSYNYCKLLSDDHVF